MQGSTTQHLRLGHQLHYGVLLIDVPLLQFEAVDHILGPGSAVLEAIQRRSKSRILVPPASAREPGRAASIEVTAATPEDNLLARQLIKAALAARRPLPASHTG